MKLHQFCPVFLPLCCVAGLLVLAPGLQAGPAKTETPVATGTNSVDSPIPQAVFDITSSPVKDPFFPRSTRLAVHTAAATNSAPTINSSAFSLKGLSGPPDQRLALINNRTVASGEDAEITTSSGKVKIHCVQVKENSVVIRVENEPEPIELWFESRSRKF
jgi:hypothetical protein